MRPKAAPTPTPETRPYWGAAQMGKLLVPRCPSCNHCQHPSRTRCPLCGGTMEWTQASGRATLESYVISHMAVPGWESDVPYAIALVRLEEGVVIMSGLLDIEPDPAKILLDMALEVGFEARGRDGEQMVPVFRPARSQAAAPATSAP